MNQQKPTRYVSSLRLIVARGLRLLLTVTVFAVGIAVAAACSNRATDETAFADRRLETEDLERMIKDADDDTIIVDVRTPREYRSGAIPTAVNIPVDAIAANPPTDDTSARIIVYCLSGSRSAAAIFSIRWSD